MNTFLVQSIARRGRCLKAGCQHDLAICGDPEAACPNGEWRPANAPPPSVQKPLPSKARMAANYATALARDVFAGMPRRDPEEIKRIVAICEACPQFRSDRRCSLCGCSVGEKIPLAMERCPEKRW